MVLDLNDRLGFDVKASEVALMTAKSDALREVGLTVAQYASLLALRDNPGISGAGLARTCLVTPQASAAVLKTLEGKGLIRRTQDDWSRNTRPNRLTSDGERLVERADALAGAIEQRIFDTFTEAEREKLRELLVRFRGALD